VEGYKRRRQKDAARIFVNAFSVDSYFYNHSEGVALCSDSHTTTSGASTAVGFDNKMTAAFSAVALAAAFIQMQGFRGDAAQVLDIRPDEIWYPTSLYEQVYEVVKSMGKVDTANNNKNVHKGGYTGVDWEYITDTNDWWMVDSSMMKDALKFVDRVKAEFGMIEDFDTLVGKWRLYARYGLGWNDWRWVLGSQVS
jgi:phage major head subunit gpT-like protein